MTFETENLSAQEDLTAARNALRESDLKFRTLADAFPHMVWSTLPDGFHDYYNARWYEFTGVPDGSTDGEELERNVPSRRSGTGMGALAEKPGDRRAV